MDKAFNLLKTVFIIGLIVYIIGLGISEEMLLSFIKEAGSKLSPYIIEILHLR